MPQLHQTEIDGVRCFWVETGRPTLSALLMFRQGQADETLPESGWLHLLEHMALHGRGGGALHVNGSVGLLHTNFDTHGPHEAVTNHLAEVTGWLSEPTFHELDRERGVLRAEAGLRGGTAARAFGWRYGAAGPGLVAHEDPGLGRATIELLTARSHRVFTRQNAVLVLDGPPPTDLRLHLPDGELLPPAAAEVIESTIPAAYVDDGGLILSGVVERSLAATVAQEILARALRERLRDTAGAAYAPWATYERVDSTHALILGGSDVADSFLPDLVPQVLHVVSAMRTEPVPEQWLAEVVAARVQSIRDPYYATGLAARAAQLYLDGEPPQTQDELIAEMHDLTAGDVAASLEEFGSSLLLGIPGKATWHDELPMLSFPEGVARREGRQFRSVDWPASADRLSIGPDRIELSAGKVARAVETSEVAGLFVFEDGGRYVIGRDGWGLHFVPEAWHNWPEAVAQLDALVPPELRMPHPAREGVGHQRLRRARRWRLGLRRISQTPAAYWAEIGLLAVLVVVCAAFGANGPALFGALGVVFMAVQQLRRQRAEGEHT